MATGLLKKIIPEENGSNYVKFPGGLLIQWGGSASVTVDLAQQGSSGIYGQNITVTFPLAFANTNYRLFGSFRYSTGASWPVGATNATVSTASVWCWDTYARSGNQGRLFWIAIGTWK